MNSGEGIFYKGAPPNTIVYALQTRFPEPDDYLADLVKQIQRAADEQMYYAPGYGQVRYDFYQAWIDNLVSPPSTATGSSDRRIFR